MDLIEVVHKIVQENVAAQKPTDLAIGTVTSTSPLTVTMNANLPPIPEEIIVLTEGVKDHVVPVYDASGTTQIGDYMIKSGLQNGDKVLMLRCMKGQVYVILSKL